MSDKKDTKESLDDLSNLNDGDFDELLSSEGGSQGTPAERINLLNDLPVRLAMMVDSIDIPIGQLLSLDEGQVLPLNKKASEPLDVTVNGKLIARGEVVVVDGRYGVRLVEVLQKSGSSDKKE